MNSYSVRGCTSVGPTLSHETSFAQSVMCSGDRDWNRGAVMSGYVYPSVRARLVGVWRQMPDLGLGLGLGVGEGYGSIVDPGLEDDGIGVGVGVGVGASPRHPTMLQYVMLSVHDAISTRCYQYAML